VNVSVLEQARIQARVLIPLIKAFRAEIGEERTDSIVRRALGDVYRDLGDKWWRSRRSDDLGRNMAAAFEMYGADEALTYRIHEQSADAFAMDVTECRYARFFKELGVPDLGFLLVCSADFHMAEGFGADVELKRTQTLMQGASCCDFRYKRDRPGG
jgi:hypothetical protein